MNILTISDLHCPFQHKDAFDFLAALKKKYKPDLVVCMGDEIDACAISRWPKDPDAHGAGHEMDLALQELHKLYKLFPDVLVCESNHTARPFRRAFDAGLPKRFIKEYKDFLEAPEGWKWAEAWEIEGIIFEHGEGASGPAGVLKAAQQNRRSTVCGHLHFSGGVIHTTNRSDSIFALNTGCLIDVSSYAFKYCKHSRNQPVIGTGVILNGIPHFIPMLLDRKGNWTGQL